MNLTILIDLILETSLFESYLVKIFNRILILINLDDFNYQTEISNTYLVAQNPYF